MGVEIRSFDVDGSFGMDVPDERTLLARQNRRLKAPYFSSGFFTFPAVWMETGQTIDAFEGLENKRP